MTIARMGVRIAAVEALRNRTLVGDQVLDSEIGALGQRPDGTLEANQECRFVAVYTQGGSLDRLDYPPRGLRENGPVELTFEMGITASMLVRNDETGKQEVFEGVPATDASFEFYLDLLGRQIVDCLLDPTNEWAEIWRRFVDRIVKIERARADSAQHVRLAGHQLKITCMLIDDPEYNVPLDPAGAVAQLLDAMEALDDASMAARAALIRSAIGSGNAEVSERIQQTLGLTAAELSAIGLAPLDAEGEALTSGQIEVDGLTAVTVTP